MKKICLILVTFILIESAHSTEKMLNLNTYDGLLFQPLTAYTFEPRLGFMNRFNTNNVRLDIGSSYDLLKVNLNESLKMSVGTDFFTYTKLRKESDFKFPVETIDYLFGINCSFRFNEPMSDFIYSLRIRLSHISAHLVDGFTDSNIFKRSPFVYSREFFDFCFALKTNNFRIYVSSDCIFHSIPDIFGFINPHFGFDFHYPLSIIKLVGGYDFKLNIIDKTLYKAHSAQLGLSYDFNSFLGLFLGFYYYNGNSIHGLFYQDIDDYFGIGFQISYN